MQFHAHKNVIQYFFDLLFCISKAQTQYLESFFFNSLANYIQKKIAIFPFYCNLIELTREQKLIQFSMALFTVGQKAKRFGKH